MLKLVPRGLFSRSFALEHEGQVIAELKTGFASESASMMVAGAPYEVRRERRLAGDFVLHQLRQELARARKPSAFRSRMEIRWDSRIYELARPSAWRRDFVLRFDGQDVGSIRPESAFTRRADVDLPDDVPLPVAAFVVALVVLMWNRDAAAASGGGS